jgi:hypothetical protein
MISEMIGSKSQSCTQFTKASMYQELTLKRCDSKELDYACQAIPQMSSKFEGEGYLALGLSRSQSQQSAEPRLIGQDNSVMETQQLEFGGVHSELTSLKRTIAKRFVASLHAEFLNDISQLNFTKPARMDSKICSRVSSHSTTDTMDLEIGDSSSDTQMVTNATPLGSSRRLNKVTELLLLFEERCLVRQLLTEEEIRSLRSLNRGVLGKVLEHFTLFKHQHSLLIAINILMFNSSKMRIPKDSFKDIVSELFQRQDGKEFTILSIKKSKTYALIKHAIRSRL